MGFYEDCTSVILAHPNNRGGASGPTVALVFHDMEYPEVGTAAEDTANFFARAGTGASTTASIDNNSICGSVPYELTAWHTGAGSPWNQMLEGYEHPGYASQDPNQWIDVYGLQMLEVSARHFAKRCHAKSIPPRRINAGQLGHAIQTRNPADGGICGHRDITEAAAVQGGHSDPGPNFPWNYYISRVQHFYGGGTPDVTIVNTPAQPIMKAATMPNVHKFADKPTFWVTEWRPTGGPIAGSDQKALELWYVPMGDIKDVEAGIRNGHIASLRTLGGGPDKNGSPDNDAAFEYARSRGRVIGL